MRKVSIAAVALAAVLALGGVALAANKYEVHLAGTKPSGKGSPSKPLPVQVKFGFKVMEDDPSLRATPIKTYSIGSEGLVAFPKSFPKCSFGELDEPTGVPAKCKKAKVGSGLVKNAAGPSNDQALASSLPCNLRLTLYNIGDGMALRLDSDGKGQPPSFESNEIGCPLPIGTAIRGKFVKAKIGGLPSSDLRFTVPPTLLHPVGGIDNSVRTTESLVNRRIAKAKVKGKKRKIGFYSSIGCKGRTRTIRVTFTDEQGGKFQSTTNAKC